MITGGASQDLGGISLGSSGLIFVYDGSVGGNGASRALYDRLDKAFDRTLSILSECPCTSESGCPRCTYSYRCGNNNEYLHKKAAAEAVGRIVDGEKTEIGEQIWGDRALV
jgi:DEAD/DEAH box helicase domain-containing protein